MPQSNNQSQSSIEERAAAARASRNQAAARNSAVRAIQQGAQTSRPIAEVALDLPTTRNDNVAEARAISAAVNALQPSGIHGWIPDFIYNPAASLREAAVNAVRGMNFNPQDTNTLVDAAACLRSGNTPTQCIPQTRTAQR